MVTPIDNCNPLGNYHRITDNFCRQVHSISTIDFMFMFFERSYSKTCIILLAFSELRFFFCFFFCFPVIACLNIAQATFCREEKDVVYLYIMLPKYSTWGKISVYVLLKYQYKCCSFFALRLLKQSLSTETTRNLFHKQGLGVGRSGISVLSFKFCFSVVTIIFSKNGLLCIPEVAHCN